VITVHDEPLIVILYLNGKLKMMTLLQEIEEAKQEIRGRLLAIQVWQERLTKLEQSRAYCKHEWDVPLKEFEHEGCLCKLCGINDQYAPTHKKMVESNK